MNYVNYDKIDLEHSNKSVSIIFLYVFLYIYIIYIKMARGSSDKHYQDNKGRQ